MDPTQWSNSCDRCFENVRVTILSKFNLDTLCVECSEDEKGAPGYAAACEEEIRAVRAGVRNFAGIGLSKQDRHYLADKLRARKGVSAHKTYTGERPADDRVGDCRVTVESPGVAPKPLRHVELHSPDGFEWGYYGSGPADLALSILADHLGERPTRDQLYHGTCRSVKLHQQFKEDVVASFVGNQANHWTLTSEQVEAWLKEHDRV